MVERRINTLLYNFFLRHKIFNVVKKESGLFEKEMSNNSSNSGELSVEKYPSWSLKFRVIRYFDPGNMNGHFYEK